MPSVASGIFLLAAQQPLPYILYLFLQRGALSQRRLVESIPDPADALIQTADILAPRNAAILLSRMVAQIFQLIQDLELVQIPDAHLGPLTIDIGAHKQRVIVATRRDLELYMRMRSSEAW